jgi:hypothetical protein
MGSPSPRLIDHTANHHSRAARVRTTHGPGNPTIPGASPRRKFERRPAAATAWAAAAASPDAQLTLREVSSMTKEVCCEESSTPEKLIVTVWPASEATLKDFWVYPVFLFRLE